MSSNGKLCPVPQIVFLAFMPCAVLPVFLWNQSSSAQPNRGLSLVLGAIFKKNELQLKHFFMFVQVFSKNVLSVKSSLKPRHWKRDLMIASLNTDPSKNLLCHYNIFNPFHWCTPVKHKVVGSILMPRASFVISFLPSISASRETVCQMHTTHYYRHYSSLHNKLFVPPFGQICWHPNFQFLPPQPKKTRRHYVWLELGEGFLVEHSHDQLSSPYANESLGATFISWAETSLPFWGEMKSQKGEHDNP
jgi:hypothetical protein